MKYLTPALPSSSSSSFTHNMRALTSTIPDSSSFFAYRWTYDVFLSFRGEDTRNNFTGFLYSALQKKGIHTFIDDRLERGEEIAPALLEAIDKSKIAIVILSANYASSTFCLQELVKILECKEQNHQLVLPIFYKVDPSDVRHVRGSFREALARHEHKFKDCHEKVQNWRSALEAIANLSGRHFKGDGYEYEFVETIVEEISQRINPTLLYVANYQVGLKSRIEAVISLLCLKSNGKIITVGIHGTGGIGKTTIANAVHNTIVDQFEGVCFLSNVRERSEKHGLVKLQNTLLFELTGEKRIKIRDVNKGIPIIRRRLCQKKVLLILDDVNSQEQLGTLAGGVDWFGVGSRIIITTRDKHLLNVYGVSRNYEVKELCFEEALELFSWNAFKKNKVDLGYESISECVINYCNGLPLALEIIGSNLFNKTQEEWKSALDTYKNTPIKDIQSVLEISYNGLEEAEKEIFLDIACFFNEYYLEDVETILRNGRGYDLKYGIGVLVTKSIIKIDKWHKVQIHDLIVQMGKQIVRCQSRYPECWNRLWNYNDILCILQEDKGTDRIEALMLKMPEEKEVQWNGKALKKMTNLKILIIENAHFSCGPKYLPNSLRVLKWENCSLSTLPSHYDSRNLAILNLCGSSFRLDKSLKNFESLTELVLRDCQFLKHVPDISGASCLRKINVSNCPNLVEVHDSVGFHNKLASLNVSGCFNLRIFPRSIKSASLHSFNFSRCAKLESIPEMFGFIEKNLAIEYLNSFGCVVDHGCLLLYKERNHVRLNCGLSMLPKLQNWMDGFQHFIKCGVDDQEKVSPALSVTLTIYPPRDGEHFKEGHHFFPPLDLDGDYLTNRYFSTWRPFYRILTTLNLRSCNLTEEFLYQRLPWFPSLKHLYLGYNKFTILPECMNEYHYLETLSLSKCEDLREVKGIPPNIKYLEVDDCLSLTFQSSRKLLSQCFHEDGGREVVVPGYRIPEWLDHRSAESSISFWFRDEFPRLALWFVRVFPGVKIRLFINGNEVSGDPDCWFNGRYRPWREVPCIEARDLHGWVKVVVREDEWNHVLISHDDRQPPHGMGVHVYKKGPDNVRFINPNPLNRTFTINHKLDLVTSSSLSKRFCPVLGMQVSDTTTNSQEREEFYRFMREGDEYGTKDILSIMEAPTKVKGLIWKLKRYPHELPTCCNLFCRKLVKSSMCLICGTEYETLEHVFLECPWTQPLWFESDFAQIMNDKWSLLFGIGSWLEDKFHVIMQLHPNAGSLTGLLGNILWAIWKARNEFVLRDKPVNPVEALLTAKAMHMHYCFEASSSTIHPDDDEMEPIIDKGKKVRREFYQIEKRGSNEVDNTANRRRKGLRNNTKEANSDKGIEVENKAKGKKGGESNSNTEADPNFDKVEGLIAPLDHISIPMKVSDIRIKKVEELRKQQEEANQIFLKDENEEEARLQKRKDVIKSQSTTVSNQPSNLEPKKLQKKTVATLQKSAQEVSANVTQQRISSVDKNSFESNPNSATSPKIQEISSCSISQLVDYSGKNEEPDIEQNESTFNQENPDLPNLNIQLEIPNPDIQPQNIAPNPKQPFPAKTQPNSTQEKHSISLNDEEEDDPFAVLMSLVSADEDISTSTSHVSAQESRWNSKRASQIKQTITILDSVLKRDFELLLSNQEDREKLESSLKILQSMSGEDALITFSFKTFILQLRDQLPSMLQNMSKSSIAEEEYQSLIRHKRSLAEFHKSGGQQKQQLAEKHQACIEKVEANSNQISALRARILELQKELEQLENTQPELEAAVKAMDIEEQNLIKRAKDAIKDFKSTANKLSGMEAERKAMIEVKSKTLIQWQNFKSTFDSSFKKLIVD